MFCVRCYSDVPERHLKSHALNHYNQGKSANQCAKKAPSIFLNAIYAQKAEIVQVAGFGSVGDPFIELADQPKLSMWRWFKRLVGIADQSHRL